MNEQLKSAETVKKNHDDASRVACKVDDWEQKKKASKWVHA